MVFKSISVLVAVLSVCGCASTPSQSKTAQYNPSDYTNIPDHCKSDTSPDVVLTPTKEVPVSPRVLSTQEEEQNYMRSLSRIQEQFQNEQLQLRMCQEVHSNDTYCSDLLKSFCKVDEFLDTRGGIHRKPYCLN